MEALGECEFELFIVDDTSTDGTPELADELAAGDPRVRCIHCGNGPSRRENLAESFKQASGDAIAFIDADLSVDPSYLQEIIAGLGDNDIVVGSRYLPESRVRRRLWRQAFSRAANLALRLIYNSKLRDHQCGLKAFRRDVILKLVEEAGYDHRMVRSWAWDSEILLRAQRHGYRIMRPET